MNAFSKNCFKAKRCDFILFAAVSVNAQENVTFLRFEGRPRGGLPWPLPDWGSAGYAAGETTPSASPSNFNVLDYGASSSGLKDASDAIQRAINAAASSGNGTVYLPPGRYLLTKPLRITKSKVVIKGAGWDATTILINKPLSAVYNGGGGNSSTVLPPMTTCTTGTSQSPYSWAGGFIRIGGFIPTDRSETRLATQFGPCTYGALMAFVGNFHGTPCESYYMRKDLSPQPPDLFTSQQNARLGKAM